MSYNPSYYGPPVEMPRPIYQGGGWNQQKSSGGQPLGQPYPQQPQQQYQPQPQYQQPQYHPEPQIVYVQRPPAQQSSDSCCIPCACLAGFCTAWLCCPCVLCC